ncbi:cation:proton antiporter [Streptomyces sp. NBC_01754]|uniref:cation:proton antiporter n=1 Tax=Streptomyces sp. NBC_01754 TaxID=2975930 RepID=UPI002DD9833C|nr:cation:proton antiporter [Streptomyces sp. NBC_01754]WSC90942.1 cation:proton antiporter [Streptomyces sp. NBC_01754]WSC96564.1 cation:proton antiporter [Streptomyces sp. NBC_01754]
MPEVLVPPMESHSLLVFLLQVGLLLLSAIVLGRLAARIGMPSIVGELTAGVFLGPSLLGWAAPDLSAWLLPADPAQMHMLDAVGQIAVLLLVGLTGTEMDLGLMRRRRRTALRISLSGLLIPLALGIAAGFPLARLLSPGRSDPTVFALFLGVAMCVSAIPVIAKTLMDMNLIHRNVSQLALMAGMIDDAFGWFMLSIVSAMAVGGLGADDIALTLLRMLLVLLVAVVIGRPLIRTALRSGAGSRERVVAIVVVLVLLAGSGTQALGLEAVFGAFVCGILIGSTKEFTAERTAPLRTVVLSVLAPLFFVTAGLRVDLRALAQPKVLTAALAVLVIAVAGKFAGAYLGARLSRLTKWEALALGAGMNARGVVEVIVAMVGLRLGILDAATYTIVVLVAVVTSIMAPPLLRVAMRRIEHTEEEQLRLIARGGGLDEQWSQSPPGNEIHEPRVR